MKILVTGAGGFVGKNLVAALNAVKDGKDKTRPSLKNGKVFQFNIYASVQNGVNFCKEENFNL